MDCYNILICSQLSEQLCVVQKTATKFTSLPVEVLEILTPSLATLHSVLNFVHNNLYVLD